MVENPRIPKSSMRQWIWPKKVLSAFANSPKKWQISMASVAVAVAMAAAAVMVVAMNGKIWTATESVAAVTPVEDICNTEWVDYDTTPL